MGNPRGFLNIQRQVATYRPVCERVHDYKEVGALRADKASVDQASRCMDCGTPFCHWACPIANIIPEWNDLVYHGHWQRALEALLATNNFPEFTGRLCPALCEYACVLGINDDPVTIRENELAIIEHAFKSGAIKPRPPRRRTGKTVAVIGSGPAGLACADQLNKAGHRVTVFEKDDKIGGILRYGIPDFKLPKSVIDRRIAIMQKEGIVFTTNTQIGNDIDARTLRKRFDAICLATGSRVPRDLTIEGRALSGIHFAMDYLSQSNRRVAGEAIPTNALIDAHGKHVVVIGGGDTGADCVGTAHRQKAACVVQIEVMPQPPKCRPTDTPWPRYPLILKTSSSHEEGGERHWSILTKRFIGDHGLVKKLDCVRVEFSRDQKGCAVMREIPGSEFSIAADLVLLAVGFLHPEHAPLLKDLGVTYDARGNIAAENNYQTAVPGVFAAGDARRGQSLIVWAISEGRWCAQALDRYLATLRRRPRHI